MSTATVVPKPTGWKRLAIISLFGGAGFAVVLACIGWYSSRPKPPVAWNARAIVVQDPPGFSPASDGKRLEFTYTFENTTDADYNISASNQIRIMARDTNGTFFSNPVSPELASVTVPIYIPAKQKAVVFVFVRVSELPERTAGETDAQYHERLRTFLNKDLGRLGGFTIFDDARHYEINLPRWHN